MSKFTRKNAAAPVAAIFGALARRTQITDDGIMVDIEDFEGDVLTHGDVTADMEDEGTLTEEFTVFSNPDGSIIVLPRFVPAPEEDPRDKLVGVTGLENVDMPLLRNNPFAVTLLAPRR